jgi:hypothetical protein
MREIVNADADLCARFDILTSIPGVSAITAFALLVEMPELGALDAGEAACLAGLAPIARQSGRWTGRSLIRGGRAGVRQAVYMPALVAMRFNADLKTKYDNSLPPENQPRSPSPPSCESSSSSPTPCSKPIVSGSAERGRSRVSRGPRAPRLKPYGGENAWECGSSQGRALGARPKGLTRSVILELDRVPTPQSDAKGLATQREPVVRSHRAEQRSEYPLTD